jgi:hypothetical protein
MGLHTNYFFPYNSDAQKENSLTRAFFSLVKLVPPAGYTFYSMLHKKAEGLELDHPLELEDLNYEVQIQQQKLPESFRYVSVLLSDDVQNLTEEIEPVDRNAQYDAVFQIGQTCFFIENKPYNNIGSWQLCPAEKDINSEESEVAPKAINLTWKEIITSLNKLAESSQVSETQKELLEDFFTFVDHLFVNLNPFDRLDRCKSSHLVQRRLEKILREVASDPESVSWHQGWANAIPTPDYPFIGKIGIPLNYDNEDEFFRVTLIFADTVAQARPFYKDASLNLQNLLKFNKNGWEVGANFHLGFMQANYCYMATPGENVLKYLEYWQTNSIDQINAAEGASNVFNTLDQYLKDLHSKGLIIYNADSRQRVFEEFGGEKKRKKASVRPGFYAHRVFSREEAERLDKTGELAHLIREEIRELFLNITGESPNFIKRSELAKL